MRGAPVHLHPSRPDGSPPSAVQRHHKPENADEHSDNDMSSYILSLMRSEWGMRGAPVHLHPSRPDGSPPSTVRRHHKHENADEHSDNNMSSYILSLMRSEWGMRGAPVHLHPSHQDGSPPSAVRRHHKPENTDEHSASSMSPYILPAVCLTSRSSNTRTCREQDSDIRMFLNARRCCSEGGMRGALAHLHPTRPRVSNRDRGHLRGALLERSPRILHERVSSSV